MAKKFPNPMNTYKPTDPRNPMKSSIGNVKRITPRHIIVKLLKVSNTEKPGVTRGGKKSCGIRMTSASSLGLWACSTGASPQHPVSPCLKGVTPLLCKVSVPTTQAEHRPPASSPIELSLLRAQAGPGVWRKDLAVSASLTPGMSPLEMKEHVSPPAPAMLRAKHCRGHTLKPLSSSTANHLRHTFKKHEISSSEYQVAEILTQRTHSVIGLKPTFEEVYSWSVWCSLSKAAQYLRDTYYLDRRQTIPVRYKTFPEFKKVTWSFIKLEVLLKMLIH